MKKLISFVLAGAMLFTLTACGGSGGSGGESAGEGLKIALVCSAAGKNDNGYNQSAVEALPAIAQEVGAEYKVIEPTNGVPVALETLAEDGYNIIFSLEYDFDALIQGVGGAAPLAEQYPETTFVVFNDNPNKTEAGDPIHKNVVSVLFDVHEAAFLAGALTAQVIENNAVLFEGMGYQFADINAGGRAVGFIGGTNSAGITVFSYGFAEGVNYIAAQAGVKYDYYAKYDAGFADPSTGSTVAGTYYSNGVNTVFGSAGVVGDGIVSKAKEVSRLAIQVDADKDAQQPGFVLTSVMKNTNVPVRDIVTAIADKQTVENTKSYALETGATGITDLSVISKSIAPTDAAQAKWKEIQQALSDISAKIASGEIVVTDAQAGEQLDTAALANVNFK